MCTGSNIRQEIPESELKEFLSPAAAMVVTVASTTTEGKKLSEEEICGVEKACDVMTELDIAKRNVSNCVLQRDMRFF